VTAQLDTSACPTPFWLPDPHSQTLYSALVTPTHTLRFVRERVVTPDGDFIDLDWSAPGIVVKPPRHKTQAQGIPREAMADRWLNAHDASVLNSTQNTHALVLLHGLEGSSSSRYAQSIMQYFRARGWVVVMAHFRGCSGVPNRLARAYYSGDSEEVGFILKTVQQHAPHALWHAVGVSLGGNALLKYLGQHAADIGPSLQSAAAVAAPIDLWAAGEQLSRNFFAKKFIRVFS
jgi:predicted alpha/beta-fold hydrolase